jgi:virulence-associated protein VapD
MKNMIQSNTRGGKFMYAIAFDLKIDDLKKHYGEPYNNAYNEIQAELEKLNFSWIQGSVYINFDAENNLTAIYKAINKLSQIDWFKKSVRDIRAFKVEDWSDFTEIVKN